MHHFMRTFIAILISLFCQPLISQEIENGNYQIDKIELLYSDSANGEFAYGQYEPTSLIKLTDKYFISSKLSISFPSQYKSADKYDSAYFAQSRIYQERSHISSGSLICLDSNLNKQWEQIFKEQRIIKLLKVSDNFFYAIGERTDMKKFWVAKFDRIGNTIWKNEFRIKSRVTIEDAALDKESNLYILLDSKKIPPIKIAKSYGKIKLRFFDDGYSDNGIYCMKINPNGKKLWVKDIDSKNKTNYYAKNILVSNDSIYLNYSYSHSYKHKGEWKQDKVNKHVTLSLNTKKGTTYIGEKNTYLFVDSLITSADQRNDTIEIYHNHKIDSKVILPSSDYNPWILKGVKTGDNYFILGTLKNNLGSSILILDKDYKVVDFWINSKDLSCSASDFIVLDNDTILLLIEKWESGKPTGKRYIELKKIKTVHNTRS